jgi:tetratricopeptide (TPR) repeat protein
MDAVQATVAVMQQAFKQVWMVSEGMLDFPLSDLWKMGDHYMVTLMQERLVSHLWQYVVLLPRKGAPLHRFDQEVLRRRSEDVGKGALEVTLEDAATRLRDPETVRCPCPTYPDNKMLKDVGLEMQHTLGRLRLASTCFREAADRNPADPEAWNWLATTLLNLEDYAGASKAFSAANSLQPSAGMFVIPLWCLPARPCAAREDASSEHRTRAEAGSTNTSGCTQRETKSKQPETGCKQREIDRRLLSEPPIEKLTHPPWMAAYLINMGVALQRDGRHEDAVKAYSKGLELDAGWPEAHLNQAYALQDLGRHQEAVEAYTKALKAKPNWSRAHAGLGGILSAAGHVQQATDHLQAAVKEDPFEAQHRLDLGQVPGAPPPDGSCSHLILCQTRDACMTHA